ncbi:hypothetical protein LCGC14_3105170 [marine sediment metagenome]|uniref:Uncharacterized protein n=1 Tax=marine sediment metagenome TaxID=412755 RepID=A0A0F8WVI8_9ZZZZ
MGGGSGGSTMSEKKRRLPLTVKERRAIHVWAKALKEKLIALVIRRDSQGGDR